MIKRNKDNKMYVVRSYVMAKNAKEALHKFKVTEPDECWIDDEWKKDGAKNLSSAIGFDINTNQND